MDEINALKLSIQNRKTENSKLLPSFTHSAICAHKFSITFKSGEYGGQLSETLMQLFRKKIVVCWALWEGALSCWKIYLPFNGWLSSHGTRFSSRVCTYFIEFMVPEMWRSATGPFPHIAPQNIRRLRKGRCCLVWTIRIRSSLLRGSNGACDPLTSKYVSSDNIT